MLYDGVLSGGEYLCITMLALTRYASLASITVALALPVLFGLGTAFGFWPWEYCASAAAMAVIVLVQLRPNIIRLLAGTERKVGQVLRRIPSVAHE